MTENQNAETNASTRLCHCAQWVAVNPDYHSYEDRAEDVMDGIAFATNCVEEIRENRQFLQGHDAKLKSLLIQAGAEGLEMTDQAGLFTDAFGVARRYGFVSQVEAGVKRAQAKRDAKLARDAAKAKRHEAKVQKYAEAAGRKAERAAKKTLAETNKKLDEVEARHGLTAPTMIKVGRWEYEATVNEFGFARYNDAQGEEQVREPGTFRILTP